MGDNLFRVPITMPADMVSFLEELSIKSKASGGKKLANTEIVRAAVRFIMDSRIDVSSCRNEEDVLMAIKRCNKC